MKNKMRFLIVLFLVSSLFLVTCGRECEEIKSIDPEYGFQSEVPDYETWQELMFWIGIHLYYIADKSGHDNWQTALQTWNRTYHVPNNGKVLHSGDCEDGSNFALYLLRKKFDLKGYNVTVTRRWFL